MHIAHLLRCLLNVATLVRRSIAGYSWCETAGRRCVSLTHLLATAGLLCSDYVGEAVSQLEHATQCAKCAADAGADEEVVLGALLHGATAHLVVRFECHAHMGI